MFTFSVRLTSWRTRNRRIGEGRGRGEGRFEFVVRGALVGGRGGGGGGDDDNLRHRGLCVGQVKLGGVWTGETITKLTKLVL